MPKGKSVMSVYDASDAHTGDDIARALAFGMGESTTESQHVRAIAVLTAVTPQNTSHATSLTKAIALLNASLSHLRDPQHH